MFIKYILFIFLLSIQLFSSSSLNGVYYVDTKDVNLSYILPTVKKDIKLFTISPTKHSKKLKAKELISILNKNGFTKFTSKHSYIKFIQKSPIDTSQIKYEIKNYYEEHYPNIEILSLHVEPRSYIKSIPKRYTIKIKKNSFLQKNGVISIKNKKNKKIFLNYTIEAAITVFISRIKIKKGTELSIINIKRKRIILDKFRAVPYQNIEAGMYQAKHHIMDNKIITLRDITELSLVKRKTDVSITMDRDNMDISFSAKALQNGKLNDIIRVQKSNGKILKVTVTGRNTAEIK